MPALVKALESKATVFEYINRKKDPIAVVLVFYPFEMQARNIKQSWFWKRIAQGR
jgi:hypothetical protein